MCLQGTFYNTCLNVLGREWGYFIPGVFFILSLVYFEQNGFTKNSIGHIWGKENWDGGELVTIIDNPSLGSGGGYVDKEYFATLLLDYFEQTDYLKIFI